LHHRIAPERSKLAYGAAQVKSGQDGVVDSVIIVVVALNAQRLGVENLGVGAALV
jgi:hypothetical protein